MMDDVKKSTRRDFLRSVCSAAAVPLLVSAAGAADPYALRVANLLVGNPQGAPALELTLVGPDLCFEREATVSLCGGTFEAALDGAAVGLWRAVRVAAGQTLHIGAARAGCRAVLAVRGGVHGQEVFGSRSTDMLEPKAIKPLTKDSTKRRCGASRRSHSDRGGSTSNSSTSYPLPVIGLASQATASSTEKRRLSDGP